MERSTEKKIPQRTSQIITNMESYLIETSAIIAYLRGDEKIISLIDSLEGELTSSFICLSELYEGIYRVKERDKTEKIVLEFFKGLSEVYSVDEEIARYFGKVRSRLKQKGELIEDLDILISATCLSKNLILITLNPKHFKKVEELKILV